MNVAEGRSIRGERAAFQALDRPTDGVGHGVADLFAYQTRGFLDQIAGIGELGPLPGFDEGLRGLRLVAAVAESADSGGAVVKVA